MQTEFVKVDDVRIRLWKERPHIPWWYVNVRVGGQWYEYNRFTTESCAKTARDEILAVGGFNKHFARGET